MKRLQTPSGWAAFNKSALLNKRLSEARVSNAFGATPRYTLVPAAAGNGLARSVEMSLAPTSLLRGGGRSVQPGRVSNATYRVHTANVGRWIQDNFAGAKDLLLILKMDIEGAEFSVLPHVAATVNRGLIDLLAWECHQPSGPSAHSCSSLQRLMVQKAGVRVVLSESKDYAGIDSTTYAEVAHEQG